MASVFVGHAIGMAIFVVIVGFIFNIPARKLLVPYAVLAYCGAIAPGFFYWAQVARNAKSYAFRFAVGLFFYLQTLMFALGFGAIRLGLISSADAINLYAPFTIPFSVIVSALTYAPKRKMFETLESNRPG